MAETTSRADLHRLLLSALAMGLVLSGSPGPAGAGQATDIAVIVHPQNKLRNISRAELAQIFLRKKRQWADGSKILFFNNKAGTPVRVAFDRHVLKMSPDKVAAYWIDQRIRGKGKAPRAFRSATLAQRIVGSQKTAIAYVPSGVVKKGTVKVLRVDGHAPGDKGYPLTAGPAKK